MKRVNSMVWGIVLLLAGVALTLNQLNIINLSGDMTVPIILLALSVMFHLYYFLTRTGNEGLLVPGGILLVYGFMFLAPALWTGATHGMLWPLFILGPALGLFELYAFSGGKKGSMVPVFILTAIGGGFLLYTLNITSFEIVVAIVLIGIGLGLMVSALLRSAERKASGTTYTTSETSYAPPAAEIKVDAEPNPGPEDQSK